MEPRNAGRNDNICDDIVDRHSDYLDGMLAAHEAAQIQWHLSVCANCARYDRVVRRSLELVRELPEITPSDDFAERLQHRIYHVQDGGAIARQRTVSAAATLAVAGVIALLAWSPLLLGGGDAPVASAAAERPYPQPDVLAAPTVLSGEDLWFPLPAAQPLASSDLVATLASFPGPYSPLVVNPPVHGGVLRTVSSEFQLID